MFDWNDLRYVLAVDRHGSTGAAARALGVSQSTVQRRLAALQRATGVTLAVRERGGYRLTDSAHGLLEQARAVEAAIADFADAARSQAQRERRTLRITCPEPIVSRLLPFIARFEAESGLSAEVVTSDRYVDLIAGDVDVALRSGDTDADLVGRTVATSIWAVYASRAYVAAHGAPAAPADLAGHALVSFDSSMSGHRVVRWLADIPDARIAARATSVLGLIQAVRAGAGIAPLPANIADADPGLVRLFGPVRELERSWRLLTTRELRSTPRVAAFYAFADRERAALRSILG